MALSKLSGDQHRSIFGHLCNVLDPRVALDFGSTSLGLWEPTQAMRKQLRADHEVAAALCRKMGLRSCKELREAKRVVCLHKGLSLTELATLGTLGSVLPALEELHLIEPTACWPHPCANSVQRLAMELGAGALPALTTLSIQMMHAGDAGASALAAALGRGALPRLRILQLSTCAIGDAGLVTLAPALRRLPALERLCLSRNPIGDEGFVALVPPPPPAGALPPPTAVLPKLKFIDLSYTQVSDAGCATFAAALVNGALPALVVLSLHNTLASAAAIASVNCRR